MKARARAIALVRDESGIESIETIALAAVVCLAILALIQVFAPAMGGNLAQAIFGGIIKALFGDLNGAAANFLAPILPMIIGVGVFGIILFMLVGLGVYFVTRK